MKPQGKIRPQPLGETYITPDGTLVDDTIVLVDGNVLVGSQVTPVKDIRSQGRVTSAKGKVTPRR